MTGDLPLSYAQEAQWFLHRLAPDATAYHTGAAVAVHTAPDVPALRDAVADLAARHPMLRSVFAEDAGHPVRHETGDRPHLTVHTVPGTGPDALTAAARHALDAPFAPAQRPPFRVELLTPPEGPAALLVTGHHIATDAWSDALLLRDLLRLYEHRTTGAGDPPPPPAADYDHHVTKERLLVASERGRAMRRHWTDVCRSAPPVAPPPDHRRRTGPPAGATWRETVPPALTAAVLRAARERALTPYTLLLSAFQVLLHRYTRRADFLIGCPVTTRYGRRVRDVVGNFMNTVVVRSTQTRTTTLGEVADDTAARLRTAMNAARYPFSLIAAAAPRTRDGAPAALFRTSFNMLAPAALGTGLLPLLDTTAPDRVTVHGGLPLSPLHVPQQEAQTDFAADVLLGADTLAVDFRYDTTLYERDTVARFAGHYLRTLELAVTSSGLRVATAPLWQPATTTATT